MHPGESNSALMGSYSWTNEQATWWKICSRYSFIISEGLPLSQETWPITEMRTPTAHLSLLNGQAFPEQKLSEGAQIKDILLSKSLLRSCSLAPRQGRAHCKWVCVFCSVISANISIFPCKSTKGKKKESQKRERERWIEESKKRKTRKKKKERAEERVLN